MKFDIRLTKLFSLTMIVLLWMACGGDDWRDPLGISQAGDGSLLKPDGAPFVPQAGHLDISLSSLEDIPFKEGGEELKIVTVLKNMGTEPLSINGISLTGNIVSIEGISEGDEILGSDSLVVWVEFDGANGTNGQVDFIWNSLENPDSTISFSNSLDIGDESAWDRIYDKIIDANCSCHLTSSGAGELLLNTQNVAYEQLVDFSAFEVPELKRVEPWNTGNSYLVKKIIGIDIEGDRMPRDGPPFLSNKRIEQIKTWISIGAPE
jgi:hypothetical protein